MADFIDLVVKISTDEDASIAKDFKDVLIRAKNVEELANWFKAGGYDLTNEDVSKIFKHKDFIAKLDTTLLQY